MRLSGLAAVVALLLAACGTPTVTGPTTTTMQTQTTSVSPSAELDAARERWLAAGLDTYWFRLVNDCGECDPSMREPQTVVVWSEEPTGPEASSVDLLFSHIEAAIGEGRIVEVSYHAELGHPVDISIDMQDRAFDGGEHLLVEGLVAGLPGDDVALDRLEAARRLWESQRPQAYDFRTTITCDCEIDGTIRTRVDGDRIIDWEVAFAEETGTQISPITIDIMFDDLAEMISLAGGVEADGVRFTGSAAYHPDLGYPTWVGLDVEILDPDSELAFLPPRLVFSVDRFTPIDTGEEVDPTTDVENGRVRWETAGPTNYRYELTIHDIETATFSDPYVVTVTEGVVTSVEHEGGLAENPPFAATTIEALFDLIEERTVAGDTVDALYHDELGYPVLVSMGGEGAAVDIFSIHLLDAVD